MEPCERKTSYVSGIIRAQPASVVATVLAYVNNDRDIYIHKPITRMHLEVAANLAIISHRIYCSVYGPKQYSVGESCYKMKDS